MLSRLLARGAKFSSRTQARNSVAALLAVRQLRTTAAALAGGHGHHDEALPPHIPRPASEERTWFGEQKPPRISTDSKYKPGSSDIWSFVGAGVGVLLTFLAVNQYTLKDDDKHSHKGHKEEKKGHGEEKKKECHKKEEKKDEPCCHEKKEDKPVQEEKHEEHLHPVVEKKLVLVPVEVPATHKEQPEHPKEEEASTSSSPASTEPSTSQEEQKPLEKGQVPDSVPYLLIGGGTASYYAALVIRARDANARVLIVSDEPHLPYSRPPLSKELWWYGTDKTRDNLEWRSVTGRIRDVFHEAEGFFVAPHDLTSTAHGGVSIVCGRKVTRVDATTKKAILDDGTEIAFEQCLIATGGRPRTLAELESAPASVRDRVLYFRGVDDYRKLNEASTKVKSITVVGGGFLGSELTYSIKRAYPNLEINQVFPEDGQLAAVLPAYLSKYANEEMSKMGVNVLSQSKVVGANESEGRVQVTVETKSGEKKELLTDMVVVAAGIEPNVELAKASGFEIDPVNGGIMADAELRVRGNVFAAGDACSFYDAQMGRRRVEHWEQAQTTGRLAGENMTGGSKAFWYQSSFFTRCTPSLIINAVGDTSSKHETVSVYTKTETGEKYNKGIVFYVNDDRVVGVLLVNLVGSGIDVARRLIDDRRHGMDYKELAKLFPLYENEKPEEENGEEKKKEE